MLATNAADGESRLRRVGEGQIGGGRDSVNTLLQFYFLFSDSALCALSRPARELGELALGLSSGRPCAWFAFLFGHDESPAGWSGVSLCWVFKGTVVAGVGFEPTTFRL
jgi:hypothetical protein